MTTLTSTTTTWYEPQTMSTRQVLACATPCSREDRDAFAQEFLGACVVPRPISEWVELYLLDDATGDVHERVASRLAQCELQRLPNGWVLGADGVPLLIYIAAPARTVVAGVLNPLQLGVLLTRVIFGAELPEVALCMLRRGKVVMIDDWDTPWLGAENRGPSVPWGR